jgi:Protein of unknown function (DUF2750)
MAAPAWEIDEAEVREILALPPAARYASFVQLTADWEETWGLKDDNGWIVRGSDSNEETFPLWPHATFARLCAHGTWEGAVPERISLDDLLDDLLPLLEEDAIVVEVFPTPEGPGTVTTARELRQELERELDLGE